MATTTMDEKHGVEKNEVLYQVETNDSEKAEAEKRKALKIDYSGAHEKTDPAEIALVKKLDWYIMPT